MKKYINPELIKIAVYDDAVRGNGADFDAATDYAADTVMKEADT